MTTKKTTPAMITLIRGDGIGPEISEATLAMLQASGAALVYEEVPAGVAALASDGTPIPDRTLESIATTKVALKGPLTTPKGEGFRSVNVAMRQHFDLFANVRPAQTLVGVPSRYANVDIVIVRENTEDLYAGIEHYVGHQKMAAESIAVFTRIACERIISYAFEYASRHHRRKVSIVHKANIMKLSHGMFLEMGRAVASKYPHIECNDVIVDAACMKLVTAPESFDVIVTTNLFGDILSDLVSGLVGGLGVSPGANLGEGVAIFEAVHGSAPDIAGKGLANPTALALASAMMLEHLGQHTPATRLRQAIYAALQDPYARTKDLGGKGSTQDFTKGVLDRLS